MLTRSEGTAGRSDSTTVPSSANGISRMQFSAGHASCAVASGGVEIGGSASQTYLPAPAAAFSARIRITASVMCSCSLALYRR